MGFFRKIFEPCRLACSSYTKMTFEINIFALLCLDEFQFSSNELTLKYVFFCFETLLKSGFFPKNSENPHFD